MQEKHKKFKTFIQFITNPKLLLCILIAWLITNGWSYILLGIGVYFKVDFMVAIASAYIAFLWMPISPEKILTFIIAIVLLQWLFPNDQKTLAILKRMYVKIRKAFRRNKNKKSENKE